MYDDSSVFIHKIKKMFRNIMQIEKEFDRNKEQYDPFEDKTDQVTKVLYPDEKNALVFKDKADKTCAEILLPPKGKKFSWSFSKIEKDGKLKKF